MVKTCRLICVSDSRDSRCFSSDQRPAGANTAYSKATMLLSPDGYMIHITEHIKG